MAEQEHVLPLTYITPSGFPQAWESVILRNDDEGHIELEFDARPETWEKNQTFTFPLDDARKLRDILTDLIKASGPEAETAQ